MTAGLPGDKILGGDFLDKSSQGNVEEMQAVEVDLEWIYLLLTAKKAGIQADDIRRFFNDKAIQVM